MTCVRNCVVVAEERPRINLTTAFSTLFSGLGLSPRAVSTSFGSRANVAICTQVMNLRLVSSQSSLGKKMATGTFPHNSWHTKTFINALKYVQKNSKIFKSSIHNVISTGTNIAIIWLSLCLMGCVKFARYRGKM